MNHAHKVALAMVGSLLLTACASQPPAVTSIDIISERVAEATTAQQELASVVAAAKKAPKRVKTDLITDSVTLDYVGSIEVILASIARQYDFKFEVLGKRPPEGLLVNIYVKKPMPVVDILKAVAYQYPTLVDVNVTQNSIELIYKG